MRRRRGKLFWFFVEADRWLNVATGGNYPHTLSYRWGLKRQKCRFCLYMCVLLHWFDPDHCDRSVEHYNGRGKVDKNDFWD